jgi:hypothetical protein
VSFRLSSVTICRVGIVGFACLTFAGASYAGEGARNIEVVPLHGTPMDTNFDQSTPDDQQLFKAWSPRAPRTTQPPQRPSQIMMPPPQSQNTISPERERELLDRRRNWVFMTPEDYASPDGKKDGTDDNGLGKKSTVMERYYQHLSDADHQGATNQFGNLDAHRSAGRSNLLSGELRESGDTGFHDSPFSAGIAPGVFQNVNRVEPSNPFGSDNIGALRTPEEVRLETEQKAHMDSFRQLWNIDQQPSAPVVVAPAASAVDSGPLFGLSSPGIQSARPTSFSDAGSSSQNSQPIAPRDPSARYSKPPPHADFAAPQRPF